MYLLYVLESNHAELLYYMLMIKQVTSTTLVVFCLAHPAKFLVSLGDIISEYSQFVNHLTTIYDYMYTHILNIYVYICTWISYQFQYFVQTCDDLFTSDSHLQV